MSDSIEVSFVLPAPPARIYRAWLDSREHSAFTGGEALIEPFVGGSHSAWDGYIEGKTLELQHGRRIVQSWRTAEFPRGGEDSRLEVRFEDLDGGTRVDLFHSNIPQGQGAQYEEGWQELYAEPMRRYFARRGDEVTEPAFPIPADRAPSRVVPGLAAKRGKKKRATRAAKPRRKTTARKPPKARKPTKVPRGRKAARPVKRSSRRAPKR